MGQENECADRLMIRALAVKHNPANQFAGALVIYCAGCMLAVQDEMQAVDSRSRDAIGGQPFLVLYTFGGQGCALLGDNTHAIE